jgi:hypothetical protein
MVTARRGTKIFIGSNQYPGALLGVLKFKNEPAKMVVVCYDEARSGIPAARPFAIPSSKVMPQEAKYQAGDKQGFKYHSFEFDWSNLETMKYIPTGAGLAPEGLAPGGVKNNTKRYMGNPKDHEDT